MNRRTYLLTCEGQTFAVTAHVASGDQIVERMIQSILVAGFPLGLARGNFLEGLIDAFFDIAVVAEVVEHTFQSV